MPPKRKKNLDPMAVLEAERAERRLELLRELAVAEANARRLRWIQRERMARLKLPEARAIARAAQQGSERAVDNKDYNISLLLDALDSANEEKRKSDNLHVEQIDRLLVVYSEKMRENDKRYKSSVEQLIDVARERMDRAAAEQKAQERYLQTVIFRTRHDYAGELENINVRNLAKLDAQMEKNDDVWRITESVMSLKLERFSDELTSVLKNYESSTKNLRKDYNALKKKDDADQDVMERQAKRIQQLYVMSQKLKLEIEAFASTTSKDLDDYRFENNYFYDVYTAMQNRLLSEQILDKNQLKLLAMEYNKTLEFLKRCSCKVEKIFNMLELCEKYEVYDDKATLYPLTSVIVEKFDDDDDFQEDGQVVCNDNVLNSCLLIRKFYKLIKRVERDVDKLKDERKFSSLKSKHLKRQLSEYMHELIEPPPAKQVDDGRMPIIIELKDAM